MSRRKPILTILIGANGSGKSTFYGLAVYRDMLPGKFFNADTIAAGLGNANDPENQRIARNFIDEQMEIAIANGIDFGLETTYSGESRPNLVRRAHAAGYEVHAIFIGTRTSEINKRRVRQRHAGGGHDIPPQEIERRWTQARAGLIDTWNEIEKILFIDTSDNRFERVGLKTERGVEPLVDPIPEWLHYIHEKTE